MTSKKGSKLSRRKFLAGSAATAAGAAVATSGISLLSERAEAFFNVGAFWKKPNSGTGQTSNGYLIGQSLRFNATNSSFLSRTPSSAGTNTQWTLSFWLKRGALSDQTKNHIFSVGGANVNNYFRVGFGNANGTGNTDSLYFQDCDSSGNNRISFQTLAAYRDPSAWYHIVISVNTSAGTQANQVRLFVNGNQVTAFGTAVYPTTGIATQVNSTYEHRWGYSQYGIGVGTYYAYDGYLAEAYLIDGIALDANSFGQVDSYTGQWIPKAPSVSDYGKNGCSLNFSNSGSLGADSAPISGNHAAANNWTPTNFAAYDQMLDSPTNNFCTLNPFDHGYFVSGYNAVDFSKGNLTMTAVANAEYGTIIRGTIGVSSGKWYWRAQCSAGCNGYVAAVGVHDGSPLNQTAQQMPGYINDPSGGWAWYGGWGWGGETGPKLYHNGSASALSSVQYYQGGDWVEIALDMDVGKIWFGKNGTWSGNPSNGTGEAFSGLTGTIFPCASASWNSSHGTGGWTFDFQGGTPPAGFKALCTANLSAPTIKKASQYFNAVTYTGSGASKSLTGVGFQPDLIWSKPRNITSEHGLYDSLRGPTKALRSNNTAAEITQSDAMSSIDLNGYTITGADSNSGYLNYSGWTYVNWFWKKGATPGFDIVTDTSPASGVTGSYSHGLGAKPAFIVVKTRAGAGGGAWSVSHKAMAANMTDYYMNLNSTSGVGTQAGCWGAEPTTTQFSITSNVTGQANTSFIAYLWAEIAGFSKFGSYTGNNSSDGPFVYCGFKPKYVLIKAIVSGQGGWAIFDSARYGSNPCSGYLCADVSSAEDTSGALAIDALSNGFRPRATNVGLNGSGATYIFAAFAEVPFKYSTAR
jgi:hypothetical protein